jgi:CheY-like chemotaxis protein
LPYTSVTEIIALAEETQPDLVLLDYLLGGINDGEYCHQLKHHPHTGHIPVIMLSAYQRVIESLGDYGWDAFVAKPFDLEQLARQTERLLQKSAT